MTLLEWAQRSTIRCPKHGGHIPESWVKYTCWCPVCEQIWRVRRSRYTWKAWWYYVNPERRKNANTRPS